MSDKEDPDEQNCVYGNGKPMSPAIAELHDQLIAEVERLGSMIKASIGPIYAPGGYAKGLAWISTKDEYGERSEFSKRLAKARALFEALAALEGIP